MLTHDRVLIVNTGSALLQQQYYDNYNRPERDDAIKIYLMLSGYNKRK
jgi:hypothetical protein